MLLFDGANESPSTDRSRREMPRSGRGPVTASRRSGTEATAWRRRARNDSVAAAARSEPASCFVSLAVGAHDVHARNGAILDEFQCVGQRHVVQLHPALEDIGRAKYDANRRRQDRRMPKHRIHHGSVQGDGLRRPLIE